MHMQQELIHSNIPVFMYSVLVILFILDCTISPEIYTSGTCYHTTFSVYLTSNIASEDVSVIEKIIQGYLGAIYFVTSLGLISHKMITCLAPLTNIGYLSYGLMIHLKLSASQKTPKGLLLTSNRHCKQLSYRAQCNTKDSVACIHYKCMFYGSRSARLSGHLSGRLVGKLV